MIVLLVTWGLGQNATARDDAGGGSYSDVRGVIFPLFRPARQHHRNRA
ncbi:hypothetical protein PCA20602_02644 [Pandoraea capi]|uniref:Uncharacterized protein n=1 Tax=Pandoraea capi TaxID=2508286 RepID=A0ABY6W1B4_9BURK|nr:hypothetical protein PCA20602_02644 [Pandoraea capi]